ncbi:unnamed protein product [Closterium sp. Yama58-4]|nr:unnamed protein product [Closterium sp. Yama58-4]
MRMGESGIGVAGAGEAGELGFVLQGPQQQQSVWMERDPLVSDPFEEEELGFECEVGEEPQQQGVWAEGGAGFASEEEFEDFVREASDFSAQASALRIGLIALMDEESPSGASAAAASAARGGAGGDAGATAGASAAAPATSSLEAAAASSAPIPPAFSSATVAAVAPAVSATCAAPVPAASERLDSQVLDSLGKPSARRFPADYTGYDDPGGYSSYAGYNGYSGYGSEYGASITANADNGAAAASANGGDGGSSSGYAASSLADRLDKPHMPLCTLPRVEAAAGACCARGPSCPFPHGDLCPHCGRYCLHPARPTEREEHMKECLRLQRKVQALKLSSEIECSVCLERVLGKARPADRKFGILSHCDHPFCVACIRNWRAAGQQESGESVPLDLDNAVRACPVCRVRSHFVTPSVVWFFSEEEKQAIIEGYKRKLKSTDCRYFNYGNGQCPFGTSCFYKHAYRDGRLEEVKLRHLSSADGSAVISRDIRLSDFLALVACRRAAAVVLLVEGKECLTEHLEANEAVTGSFVVIDVDSAWLSEAGTIDFEIIGPHNLKLYSAKRKAEDNFQFRSMYSGDYSFCMDNTDHMAATVQLSYHIGHKPHTHEVAKDEHMQGVLGQVESIRSGLVLVQQDQAYFQARDERRRRTNESTKQRVFCRPSDGRRETAFVLSGNKSGKFASGSVSQQTNVTLPRIKLTSKPPRQPASQRLSVRASAVSRDGGSREVWELPPSWSDFPIVRTIAGVAVLFAIERALAASVRAYSFPVPAPVLMLAGIGALMATGLKEAELVYDWCYPAISFFDQWMPLFFVPSVVSPSSPPW